MRRAQMKDSRVLAIRVVMESGSSCIFEATDHRREVFTVAPSDRNLGQLGINNPCRSLGAVHRRMRDETTRFPRRLFYVRSTNGGIAGVA